MSLYILLKRKNHGRCMNIETTFFMWQHSTATPVYYFTIVVPTRGGCKIYIKKVLTLISLDNILWIKHSFCIFYFGIFHTVHLISAQTIPISTCILSNELSHWKSCAANTLRWN